MSLKSSCRNTTLLFLFLFPSLANTKESVTLHHMVYTIRDPQTDAKKFREYLEKIGEYLGNQVKDDLPTKTCLITTLMGAKAQHTLCDEKPILITILRGGLPLCIGVQKAFPDSEVGFLGIKRNEETLLPQLEYAAIPDIKDKCVILIDTMIATGGSMLDAIQILEKREPKQLIVVGAVAAEDGKKRILAYNPAIKFYAAALDPLLNHKGYIIPGLGDAGDRAYGEKKDDLWK